MEFSYDSRDGRLRRRVLREFDVTRGLDCGHFCGQQPIGGLVDRIAWTIRSRRLDATLIQIICRVLGIAAATMCSWRGVGISDSRLRRSSRVRGLVAWRLQLSAQGMVKGLFGTVTILLDRPYRVGERIAAKGQDGIVEEIGLRSTKIREFLTGHLISIPNDQMAETEIENIGKRTHIRRMSDLHLPH